MAIVVSRDKSLIDFERLLVWQADAYWSRERKPETIRQGIAESDCFVALDDGEMVAFARVITDHATFAWLCDVYVDPARRGEGISKQMMDFVFACPDYETVRWILGTRDAHALYERYGFKRVEEPDRFMTKGFRPRF